MQESTSQTHVCSSPPAMSAEELIIALMTAFRAVAPGSATLPGCNPFSSSPTTVLDSAKRTWLLGKMFAGCGEGWGKDIQTGRRANTYNIFVCPKTSSSIYPRCIAITEKQTTHLRRALPQAKRIAIVLHWLAQASSFAQIAALYAVGKP